MTHIVFIHTITSRFNTIEGQSILKINIYLPNIDKKFVKRFQPLYCMDLKQ